MRRRAPARAQASRAGCLGSIIGAMVGIVLAAVVWSITHLDALIPVVVLAGFVAGGQIAQLLGRRRGGGGGQPQGPARRR